MFAETNSSGYILYIFHAVTSLLDNIHVSLLCVIIHSWSDAGCKA